MNEVREKIESYHNFYEFLSEKTGLNVTEPYQVYEFYNGLMAQV